MHDYFLDAARLCIVMEFADGGDLQDLIDARIAQGTNLTESVFEESKVFGMFTQLCCAVKHLHDRKVLHRDLKSRNVFLTRHGVVKLGDFGRPGYVYALLHWLRCIWPSGVQDWHCRRRSSVD